MSMIETVRHEMMKAMKAKENERKNALSALLSALKAKAIDKREDLTEQEEIDVVSREVKQLKETLEATPADRTELLAETKGKLAVLEEFMPEQMDENQIRQTIEGVLTELGLSEPTMKNKGPIMKALMPLTRGKADGKQVNEILATYLK